MALNLFRVFVVKMRFLNKKHWSKTFFKIVKFCTQDLKNWVYIIFSHQNETSWVFVFCEVFLNFFLQNFWFFQPGILKIFVEFLEKKNFVKIMFGSWVMSNLVILSMKNVHFQNWFFGVSGPKFFLQILSTPILYWYCQHQYHQYRYVLRPYWCWLTRDQYNRNP